MSLPIILAKLLMHQRELADTLAHPQEIDLARRERLEASIARNQADFQSFYSEYQIAVKKRAHPLR